MITLRDHTLSPPLPYLSQRASRPIRCRDAWAPRTTHPLAATARTTRDAAQQRATSRRRRLWGACLALPCPALPCPACPALPCQLPRSGLGLDAPFASGVSGADSLDRRARPRYNYNYFQCCLRASTLLRRAQQQPCGANVSRHAARPGGAALGLGPASARLCALSRTWRRSRRQPGACFRVDTASTPPASRPGLSRRAATVAAAPSAGRRPG